MLYILRMFFAYLPIFVHVSYCIFWIGYLEMISHSNSKPPCLYLRIYIWHIYFRIAYLCIFYDYCRLQITHCRVNVYKACPNVLKFPQLCYKFLLNNTQCRSQDEDQP